VLCRETIVSSVASVALVLRYHITLIEMVLHSVRYFRQLQYAAISFSGR
jgi:hypothetical protein